MLRPLAGKIDAVCAFTGHSAVAVNLPEREVRGHLVPDDFGASMSATFLAWLSERLGTPPASWTTCWSRRAGRRPPRPSN